MSSLILPRRFKQQPPENVCDLRTFGVLSEGLRILLLPVNGNIVDVINPRQVWSNGDKTNIKRVVTKNGIGAGFNARAGASSWFSTGYENVSGKRGTFFAWMPRLGNPSTYGPAVISVGSLACQVGPSSEAFSFSALAGTLSGYSFNRVNTSLVFWASDTHCGAIADGNYSSTTTGATSVIASGSKTMRLGGYFNADWNLDAGWNLDGDIVIAGYSERVWTLDDAKSFHENPWQIFKPKKQVIYFDAPSFPVLSTLTASYITSSGGRLTAN